MKKLLAIFLALMLFPISTSAATMPQDVDSGSYYANAVVWSIERGVATGTSSTTFSPDAQCTRAQVVTFLYRYSGSPAVTAVKSKFVCKLPSDITVDNYAARMAACSSAIRCR